MPSETKLLLFQPLNLSFSISIEEKNDRRQFNEAQKGGGGNLIETQQLLAKQLIQESLGDRSRRSGASCPKPKSFSSREQHYFGILQCLSSDHHSLASFCTDRAQKTYFVTLRQVGPDGLDLSAGATKTWRILLHGCNRQSGNGLLAQLNGLRAARTEKAVGFNKSASSWCHFRDVLDVRTSHATPLRF